MDNLELIEMLLDLLWSTSTQVVVRHVLWFFLAMIGVFLLSMLSVYLLLY